MRARLLRILIALDVLLFALACLGNTRRGETASAAAWALLVAGKWQGRLFVPLIDALFWFDPHHCATSWAAENPYAPPHKD